MDRKDRKPIIVIVGPTAAGKSAVADFLLTRCDGNVINADARQIYRDIEIITAAPKHTEGMYLYGTKNVSEGYSFAQFVSDADDAIDSVLSENRIPIVVGGTGLYVDSLLQRKDLPPPVADSIRTLVQGFTFEEMVGELKFRDPEILNTIDVQNPRRVQRALEVCLQTGRSLNSFGAIVDEPYEPLIIGWMPQKEDLDLRIELRIDEMLASGGIAQVASLLAAGHSLSEPGMQSIGVAEIAAYLSGEISYQEMRSLFIIHTRQYARRQLTWFKKNTNIVWYTSYDDIWQSAQDFLQTEFSQSLKAR